MNYTKEQFEQWNSVVSTLRNEMPSVSFETWIKPLKLIAVTSDAILVLCRDNLSLTHLTSRYSNVINKAIKTIFGDNYLVRIVESTPDDAYLLSESQNIIFDFIRKQNAACSHSIYDAYRYVASFPVGNRIRNCVIVLIKEEMIGKTKLHLIIELPIHIKRGEVDHIIKGLTVINDDLETNQCYDVDILEGTVRFRTIVDYPVDIEDLDSIVSESMKIVEEDFIDIMQLIVRELAALEKAAT